MVRVGRQVRSDDEQLALTIEQESSETLVRAAAARDSEHGDRLVEVAARIKEHVSLGDPPAEEQARGAVVAGLGVDPHPGDPPGHQG